MCRASRRFVVVLLLLVTALGNGCPPWGAYPTAAFRAAPVSGRAPLEVQFTDESDSGRAPITDWAWSFGDAGTASVQNPTHTYATPGTYTVRLTVSSEAGADTCTKHAYITVETSPVIINEFLALNEAGLEDEDGDCGDWIELFNPRSTPVNLSGWALTDNPDREDKWTFPDVTIDAGGYLVVFASGKDRKPVDGGNLHTNFRLSSAGEYLALFDNGNPRQAATEFAPAFPRQTADMSYGLDDSGTRYCYFETATPGGQNAGKQFYEIFAEDPVFSAARGFYAGPFQLAIACPTAGAAVRYTLDGSEPAETNGALYTVPIPIESNTTVRACSFRDEYVASGVATYTYLINNGDALKSLPAVSIVGDEQQSLYEPGGIMGISGGAYTAEPLDLREWYPLGPSDYQNTAYRGDEWERPVSVEWIDPADNTEFQIDCGIRIHGGDVLRRKYARLGPGHGDREALEGYINYGPDWMRHFSYKVSFRLSFLAPYGPGALEYPLFPESAAGRFAGVVLHGGHTDWVDPFIKDEFARRIHGAMGHLYACGRMVNLYVNGEWKGYYDLVERLTQDFFREHSQSNNDWDVITEEYPDTGQVESGDDQAWSELVTYALTNDLYDSVHFLEVARRMDIANFIDYLIAELYIANYDWLNENWTVARERTEGAKFTFYIWDAECSMEKTGDAPSDGDLHFNGFIQNGQGRGGLNGQAGPSAPFAQLYQALRVNPTFRAAFTQRIQTHFTGDGALTKENLGNLFLELQNELSGVLPDMDTYILDTWIPQREDIVKGYFAEEGY